jgi:tol-pal system protein YbgF
MRKQWAVSMVAAVIAGAIGGALLSPAPLGAVAKEIVELLAGVNQLQQGQRDMQSSIDTKMTEMRTLVQQEADSSNKLGARIDAMQKTVQDMQANSSTQLNAASTSVQGIADNMTDMQGRITKMSQQLADMQNALQTLDSKVSALSPSAAPQPGVGGTPGMPGDTSGATNPGMTNPGMANPGAVNPGVATTPGMNPVGNPPYASNPPATVTQPVTRPASENMTPSGETLYNNALNDILTRKYELAQQEFHDYLKYYPTGPYASNSYYYLGEVDRAQQKYDEAVSNYSIVIAKYPDSFKLPSAYYQRAVAYLAAGKKTQAIADLRAVVKKFPHTDEEGYARERLKSLGVSVTANGRD